MGILLPNHILRHRADAEISRMSVGDRLLEFSVQLFQPHIRIDETDHVGRRRSDPVSLR
ncbi:hypothetical protein D3C86_2116920 [compost metagenome]